MSNLVILNKHIINIDNVDWIGEEYGQVGNRKYPVYFQGGTRIDLYVTEDELKKALGLCDSCYLQGGDLVE